MAKEQILEGVRVIDVGHVLVAHYAGHILADFGADVILIDNPQTGSTNEVMGQIQGTAGQTPPSRSHDTLNRGKRNITLDMRKPQAQEIFHKLVAKSDVVIENFRPYVMDRWGHDWPTLRSINPRLIYARCSGWGQTGPYRNRRAYGMIGEAFGGWAWTNGYPDREPMHSSFSYGDTTHGQWMATAIVMALYWRDAQGGEGQLIDMGLVEGVFRALEQQIIVYDQTGMIPTRHGTTNEANPYADVCKTKDGRYFSFSASTRGSIRDLLRALGLAEDARFREFQSCLEHRAEFQKAAAAWFKERTLAEVEATFDKYDAPGVPVMNSADLYNDPHIRAREMIVTVDDPEGGPPVETSAIVPKFSESPGKVRRACESSGARNEEVYGELLGLNRDQLADLVAEGVI